MTFWIILIVILFFEMDASWETKKHKYILKITSILTCLFEGTCSWIYFEWDDQKEEVKND